MLRAVEADTPDTPHNSVHGAIHALLNSDPAIVKVARGTYRLAKYQDQTEGPAEVGTESIAPVQVETAGHARITLLESDFYDSFATWLEETAEEVTVAVAIGGSLLKQKWGTPDDGRASATGA